MNSCSIASIIFHTFAYLNISKLDSQAKLRNAHVQFQIVHVMLYNLLFSNLDYIYIYIYIYIYTF